MLLVSRKMHMAPFYLRVLFMTTVVISCLAMWMVRPNLKQELFMVIGDLLRFDAFFVASRTSSGVYVFFMWRVRRA